MAIGINTQETVDFVLACDRTLPKVEQTVFEIGSLTKAQRRAFRRACRSPGEVFDDLDEEVLRAGLRGWRNLRDMHGKQLTFEREEGSALGQEGKVPTDDTLAQLTIQQEQELIEAIASGSYLTADDRKKS